MKLIYKKNTFNKIDVKKMAHSQLQAIFKSLITHNFKKATHSAFSHVRYLTAQRLRSMHNRNTAPKYTCINLNSQRVNVILLNPSNI